MATHLVSVLLCASLLAAVAVGQFNPSILQDSRLEPNPDGTFGFAYRTEDGIRATAKGDPSGVIQGSYSYTDPTGLKVNINYQAGSRNQPADVPAAPRHQQRPQPQPDYYRATPPRQEQQQQQYQPEPEEYRPTSYPQQNYPQPSRYSSPNDIQDDYRYRG